MLNYTILRRLYNHKYSLHVWQIGGNLRVDLRALILLIQTLALYKSLYLLTYLHCLGINYTVIPQLASVNLINTSFLL